MLYPLMDCVSCKTKGDVFIKNVMFCNVCFTQKITRKVRQVINTIPTDKIIIDCEGRKGCKPYLNILNSVCAYRHKKEIFLLNYKNIVLETDLRIIYQEELDRINANEYSILKLYTIDELAVKVFHSFVKGRPDETVVIVSKSRNVYYPFEKIRDFEISYYCKINSLEQEDTSAKSITQSFIDSANIANYSASYNIIEVIRKGVKDRNIKDLQPK